MKIKDDYHIHIKPEFLFDKYNVFKSNYAPWVYISLKLKYNYYLDEAPYKTFSIDAKKLAWFYSTTTATIYSALEELKAEGLIEEKKRKFKLFIEDVYVNKYKTENDEDQNDEQKGIKYPKFIKVYKDVYEEMISKLRSDVEYFRKQKRMIIKCIKVYYYLITHNRHCLLKNEPIVESACTQTSLERELGIDHKNIKFLLSVLDYHGYIKVVPGQIYTINKKIFDPKKDWYEKEDVDTKKERHIMTEEEYYKYFPRDTETLYYVDKTNNDSIEDDIDKADKECLAEDSDIQLLNEQENEDNSSTDFLKEHERIEIIQENEYPVNERTTSVPVNFIGYFNRAKYNLKYLIYHSIKNNEVYFCEWCLADFATETERGSEIAADLLINGKKSIYYNPDDYWEYKPINNSSYKVLTAA